MHDRLNQKFALKNLGVTNGFDSIERARHRWYHYKEGFSPVLVEKAIELAELSENDIVFDPFNGSGTTTLTAASMGFKSIGVEVNPFTSFLSKAKSSNADIAEFDSCSEYILRAVKNGKESRLLGFSTFSQTEKLEKWLFNDQVLCAFEGGWEQSLSIRSHNIRRVVQLALISSAMKNCNAKRDGKCLRYRPTWADKGFDLESYLTSLEAKLLEIRNDIENQRVNVRPTIINADVRKVLNDKLDERNKFKLCITSPPYLNTFDYTDIYRPELFLGRFVHNNNDLYKLRLRTVRSHIQAKWKLAEMSDFGALYKEAISHVNRNQDMLMNKRIPSMIQAYFEDMYAILSGLRKQAADSAHLWLIVSNSAYADKEIPVDLIIADIGSQTGWRLKEVAVLESIRRRKTKYSPNINFLRESAVIFEAV